MNTNKTSRKLTARERRLLNALEKIVTETMDYAPMRPQSTASYLPGGFIAEAQAVLDLYGRAVQPARLAA